MTRLDFVRRAILADFTLGQKLFTAASVVGVPTVLRAALGASANPVPFITYFPAVLIGAVLLGWRWAAGTTLASMAILNWVFLDRPWLNSPPGPKIAIFLFFCVSCSFLILTGDTLRRSVRQMDRLSRELEVLNREMNHRIQNAFTVVSALVRMNKSADVGEFREDILERLIALSNANRVLQSQTGCRVAVDELVEQGVAPFRPDCAITWDGPSRHLPPEAAQHLLLILHELCTNALKHGELSQPEGEVLISWTGEPLPFELQWCEIGGPPVSPPTRKGLGLRLFTGQPAFAVDVRFEPAGAQCTVRLKPGELTQV